MARTPKPYKRLPGIGRGLGSFVTLWEAGDHLMQVQSSSIGERYKRFYFRDIQAIFYRKTKRALAIRLTCGILAAICGIGALNAGFEGAAILWSVAAVLALVVVVDAIRGASCECHVKTPVQTTRLASLRRMRKMERVLSRIEPLIVDAQKDAAE